jgi:hypothetical protein
MAILDAIFVLFSLDEEITADATISASTALDMSSLVMPSFEDLESSMVLSEVTLVRDVFRPTYGGYQRIPISAERAPDFTDDFYNRVYLLPSEIDFGVILSEAIETFRIWNAYFTPVDCLSISDYNIGNLVFSGLSSPYTMHGVGEVLYTVTAPQEGDPTIEALRVFLFDVDELTLTVTGVRSIIFSFEPQSSINESLEWLTNVITPRSGLGSEQRIASRLIPRQAYRFNFQLNTEVERRRFEALIFNQLKALWGVPVWTNGVSHRGTIAIGTSEIFIDTTYTDFRAGGVAVIWQNTSSFESIKIESVNASSIILQSPTTTLFTGTKTIMPIRLGYLNNTLALQSSAVTKTAITAEFKITDNAITTGYAADLTYKSQPVLLTHCIVNGSIGRTVDPDLITIDANVGEFQVFSPSTFNIMTRAYNFDTKSKEDCWKFRQLIHAMYGRQKSIWVPTFERDMELDSDMTAVADTFEIVNSASLYRYLTVNDLITHLIFFFTDGQKECREIINIEDNGSTETITIDAALGRIVTNANCQISFLQLCRLSSDKVEMEWYRPYKQKSTLNFTVIKNEL